MDEVDARVSIGVLTAADEAELEAFERDNREFFARSIDDRGDAYFAGFAERHRSLIAENEAGTCLLMAVRDRAGRVVGRVTSSTSRTGPARSATGSARSGRGAGTPAPRLPERSRWRWTGDSPRSPR